MQQPFPYRPRSIVIPVILILLGLAFLGQNLGLFGWDIWTALWRLWPLWLIAMGLDLLLGRRTAWGSWVVLSLVLFLVGGSVWFDMTFRPAGAGLGAPVTVSQPVGSSTRAEVVIDSSVARLSITAGNAENLVEGTVTPLRHERVQKDVHIAGETLTFTLKSEGEYVGPNAIKIGHERPTWDLRLSDKVPINLRVDTGVSESRIDLSGIQLTGLTVDSGMGATEVILPATGRYQVDVDAGVGKVTIRLPKGLAARIVTDQGIGRVNVRGEFDREGKVYLSPNYHQAEDRVEITIDAGVGEILVEQF